MNPTTMTNDITLNITCPDWSQMAELLRLLAWLEHCSECEVNSKFEVEFFGDLGAKLNLNFLEGENSYNQIKDELEDACRGQNMYDYGMRPQFIF